MKNSDARTIFIICLATCCASARSYCAGNTQTVRHAESAEINANSHPGAENRHVDRLNPAYHAKTVEFRRHLDKWIADGGGYKCFVRTEEASSTLMVRIVRTYHAHEITLPHQTAAFVAGLDGDFMRSMFNKFFGDQKRSFYCAVLFMAKFPDNNKGIYMRKIIAPVRDNAKGAWDETKAEYLSEFVGLAKEARWRAAFLRDSMPAPHAGDVFTVSKDVKYDFGVFKRDLDWLTLHEAYKAAVKEFTTAGNRQALLEITCDKDNMARWARLVAEKFDYRIERESRTFTAVFIMPDIAKAFAAWARPHAAKNPALVSLAFGFLILDGYEFDDATGNYILNGIGKTHLDLITAFPDKENAARLKILMDGGNETLIESLMEKHKTTASWQKIFGEA